MATRTDVGKTYIAALITKLLYENGINAGYYKATLSGAETCIDYERNNDKTKRMVMPSVLV